MVDRLPQGGVVEVAESRLLAQHGLEGPLGELWGKLRPPVPPKEVVLVYERHRVVKHAQPAHLHGLPDRYWRRGRHLDDRAHFGQGWHGLNALPLHEGKEAHRGVPVLLRAR